MRRPPVPRLGRPRAVRGFDPVQDSLDAPVTATTLRALWHLDHFRFR